MTRISIVVTGDFQLASALWGSQCPLHLPNLWYMTVVLIQLVGAAVEVPELLCYKSMHGGIVAV